MTAAQMAKAIVGGLVALTGSVIVGLGDGHLTIVEALIAVMTGLVALGSVFQVPNAPPPVEPYPVPPDGP